MPSWIDSLRVPLLSMLYLHVEVVEAQDLQALGMLPSLLVLTLQSKEEKRISFTFGSANFQKLEWLLTNIEIILGEGAMPMLESLIYSVSARRRNNLMPWYYNCPLLEFVMCELDCANCGRSEVKAAKQILRQAEENHPNADLDIFLNNYKRKSARLLDALESILHSLDRPDEEKITTDQRELRRVITSLETLLHDDDEPQVGRYGEQELRGFATKFKSLLHDEEDTDQEEEVCACNNPP
jgi:hypothetical protein